MSTTEQTFALIRFHWRAGARVALRANAMVAGIIVFIFGSAPDPLPTIRATLLELLAQPRGWAARMEFAGMCIALAAVAVPRVTLGATSWLRSLPASPAAARRASVVALCFAQAFALFVAIAGSVVAAMLFHGTIAPAKLASVPVIIVGAAMLVLPVRKAPGPIFAIAATALAIPAQWGLTGAAVVLLVAADRSSDAITPLRRRRLTHSNSLIRERAKFATKTGRRPNGLIHWSSLTWRSLPPAIVFGSIIFPVIFVAFAYFILVHNPDLERPTALRTIRVSGSLAVGFFAAHIANGILRARPAWPWIRSLPWSASQRVAVDAISIGLPMFLFAIALAPLDRTQAARVALTVPAIAACAASALRKGASRQSGAAGEIMLFGFMSGALIAVWPLTSILIFLTTPVLLAVGARRERRSRATRFFELQHDAAGDPAWVGR